MKQVRYTQGRKAERSKAPDTRKSPSRLLVHECVRGFESHSCQFLRSKRQHFNRSSIESHSRQILRSKSQHFGLRSIWESNQEQDEADFTLQEGVIEDRMKQVRYTQGRKAERSKAPDTRNSPLRLLVHECVRGFESHSCQFLRSKRQHFNRSSIESHSRQILRSKSQHFGPRSIWESNQEQDEAHFTLQEGVIEDRMKQVRYTQGRKAERSKAPDTRNSPLRLLVHECVRRFESFCQI